MEATIAELAEMVGTTPACRALGRAPATYYRHHPRRPRPPRPRPAGAPRSQPRALSPGEQQTVLDILHTPRFVDAAPTTVWATLLDEGCYLCSPATMYRLLRHRGEVHERRRQATHPATVKPELCAPAPNRVWSWDITKLLGSQTWTYYYCYVILDIYSRYVVGWLVAARESAALAEQLIADTCGAQGIRRHTLTLHADRGSSMTSKPVAHLLADLGVSQSHSRPHVCDNPYSEAQFKTLKYRPAFPRRFASLWHAQAFCGEFFPWYNQQHRHAALGYHTPASIHFGTATAQRERRAHTLTDAYQRFPERFVHHHPTPPPLPAPVWINPPPSDEVAQ